MKSKKRVLSGILSCLTCLGSVGSASKGKPAAPPAGEARRKKGNGGNKKGDRNAKEIVGIVPGASITTPRSGLSGRDIGFLAGGAAVGVAVGGVGGYFLGRKSSGNGVKLSDVAMTRLARTLCRFGVNNNEAMSFIKAITNAKVVLPSDSEIMKDNTSVRVVFDKNFDSGVGDLTFNVEFKVHNTLMNPMLEVTCSDNEGVCSRVNRGVYANNVTTRREYLAFGLVAAVFRKCYPKVKWMYQNGRDLVTENDDFRKCVEILAQGFEIPEPVEKPVEELNLDEES